MTDSSKYSPGWLSLLPGVFNEGDVSPWDVLAMDFSDGTFELLQVYRRLKKGLFEDISLLSGVFNEGDVSPWDVLAMDFSDGTFESLQVYRRLKKGLFEDKATTSRGRRITLFSIVCAFIAKSNIDRGVGESLVVAGKGMVSHSTVGLQQNSTEVWQFLPCIAISQIRRMFSWSSLFETFRPVKIR